MVDARLRVVHGGILRPGAGIDPLLESRGIEALWGERRRTLTDSEGDDHRRLRRAVGPWFHPLRIDALRARVRGLCESLLDGASADEPFDLMADFADVVPARLFCWMVGAPDSDAAHLATLSKTLLRVFTATDEMVEPVRGAKAAMAEFTTELIAHKRRSPGDDITSMLLAAAECAPCTTARTTPGRAPTTASCSPVTPPATWRGRSRTRSTAR